MASVSLSLNSETTPFATVRADQKYITDYHEFVIDVPARLANGTPHGLHTSALSDDADFSRDVYHYVCLTPTGIPCEGSVLNGRSSVPSDLVGNWGIKGGLRTRIDNTPTSTALAQQWAAAHGTSAWMEARGNVIEMFPPADGYGLVSSLGGALQVLVGGALLPVVSAEAARAAGFEPSAARFVRDDVLSRISTIPVDGTLLREVGNPAIYVIAGGARFWVPNPTAWGVYRDALGLSDAFIRQVPAGTLRNVPTQPVDGTVVRELGKAGIWVYQGGGRFWVPDPAAWRDYQAATAATEASIRPLPPGSLSFAPVTVHGQEEMQVREDLPRDGTVVRELGRAGIWVYQGGGRFWVPSHAAWLDYQAATGMTAASIRPIPTGSLWHTVVEVNGQEEGRVREDLPRDGTLVQALGASEVLVYQGGGNFVFPSREELTAWGSGSAIRLLPAGSIHSTLVIVNDAEVGSSRDDLPRDGTLIRERSSSQAYQVWNRKKYLVSISDFSHVKKIPNGSLGRVPNG